MTNTNQNAQQNIVQFTLGEVALKNAIITGLKTTGNPGITLDCITFKVERSTLQPIRVLISRPRDGRKAELALNHVYDFVASYIKGVHGMQATILKSELMIKIKPARIHCETLLDMVVEPVKATIADNPDAQKQVFDATLMASIVSKLDNIEDTLKNPKPIVLSLNSDAGVIQTKTDKVKQSVQGRRQTRNSKTTISVKPTKPTNPNSPLHPDNMGKGGNSAVSRAKQQWDEVTGGSSSNETAPIDFTPNANPHNQIQAT